MKFLFPSIILLSLIVGYFVFNGPPDFECTHELGKGTIGKVELEFRFCGTVMHEYEEYISINSGNIRLGTLGPSDLSESKSTFNTQPESVELVGTDTLKIIFSGGLEKQISIVGLVGQVAPIKSVEELLAAGKAGTLSMIQLQNSENVDFNGTDKEGTSVLHYVAYNGNLDVAEYLIQKGAKVNALRITGGTPLMAAAQTDNMGMITLLLQNGADPELKTQNGLTALDIALKEKLIMGPEILREWQKKKK